MITKITMQGIGSFKERVEFDTDKKYIFIYGLNGVGKTLISKFLKNDNSGGGFGQCKTEGRNNEKILVYNQDFIEKVFIEQYTQNEKGLAGIFTLESNDNGDTRKNLEEIKNLKEDIGKIEEEVNKNAKQEGDLEKELAKLDEKIENELWKIKTEYKNSLFNYCLVKNSKKENKEKLFKLSLNNDTTQLSDLKNILEQFKDLEQIEVKDINSIQSNHFIQIEKDEIFAKNIVGNQNSTIAEVITKLGNSDWVKKGREFLGDDNICPFCQEKIINEKFKKQLEEYFDESYERDMSRLQENLDNYQKFYNAILASNIFSENYFIKAKKEYELEFHNLYSTLINGISKNIESIKEKIKEPSKSIKLQDTNPLFDNLNRFLQKIQQEINQYKTDLENKRQKKEEIKKQFWQIMRNSYNETIKEYENKQEKLEKERKNVKSIIEQNKAIIQEKEEKITKLQSQILNIENTINAINKDLKEMGIVDFFIKKHNENFYCIARENENKINFKTLSEGEKTIISFLYFLQLCNGKENSDEVINNKIIVIDDPISSLSHNHLFNISQLIHQNYLKQPDSDIKQVFILTHNLYFFHEIMHLIPKQQREPKNTKLYRLTKHANSKIEEITREDITNDYESYWHIIRECKNNPQEGEKYRHILPNTMRNILEYFFAFVGKEKYNKVLDDTPFQCKAFVRYLNRESHSDDINITDFKEMDIPKILEDFEKIFRVSNNEAHYKKYMKL